jgi:hypothetical protein
MLWGSGEGVASFGGRKNQKERLMSQSFDATRSLAAFDQDTTLVVVVEMSLSKWLVAAIVPGLERRPLKKLDADPEALLKLLHGWRDEAEQSGQLNKRIVVAYEAGRDGFWLARWLQGRAVEAHVIHPSSVAVSREHRRAKTDRLDTELLIRAFLGWLRGEKRHCSMGDWSRLARSRPASFCALHDARGKRQPIRRAGKGLLTRIRGRHLFVLPDEDRLHLMQLHLVLGAELLWPKVDVDTFNPTGKRKGRSVGV